MRSRAPGRRQAAPCGAPAAARVRVGPSAARPRRAGQRERAAPHLSSYAAACAAQAGPPAAGGRARPQPADRPSSAHPCPAQHQARLQGAAPGRALHRRCASARPAARAADLRECTHSVADLCAAGLLPAVKCAAGLSPAVKSDASCGFMPCESHGRARSCTMTASKTSPHAPRYSSSVAPCVTVAVSLQWPKPYTTIGTERHASATTAQPQHGRPSAGGRTVSSVGARRRRASATAAASRHADAQAASSSAVKSTIVHGSDGLARPGRAALLAALHLVIKLVRWRP